MQSRRLRLMGKLVYANKWFFLTALLCTVFTVIIDFITPIVLAETLDYYLQGKHPHARLRQCLGGFPGRP